MRIVLLGFIAGVLIACTEVRQCYDDHVRAWFAAKGETYISDCR